MRGSGRDHLRSFGEGRAGESALRQADGASSDVPQTEEGRPAAPQSGFLLPETLAPRRAHAGRHSVCDVQLAFVVVVIVTIVIVVNLKANSNE